MAFLFFMMSIGLTFMVVGFKGYHVSYLSIFEVIKGERPVTELFTPRIEEPIRRDHLGKPISEGFYDINDRKSYYVKARYNISLQYLWDVLLKRQTMFETAQLLNSLPSLTKEEIQFYQTRSYLKETSENKEITKYLNQLPQGHLTTQFNLLERAIFAAVKKLEKEQLIQLITDSRMFLNYNESRIQAAFAIFEYDVNGKLISIVSR